MANQAFMTPLSQVLPEVIERSIIHYSYVNDKFYQLFDRTTDRVKRGEGIGRNWLVQKPVRIGVAGAVKVGSVQSTDELRGNTNKQWVAASQRSWPGLDEIGMVGFDNLQMTLVETKGNFAMPVSVMRADTLPATVVGVLAENIQGVGENFALTEIQSLYSSSSTTKQLGLINGSPTFTGGSPVAKSWAQFEVDNGRINMFRAGMFVDVVDPATGIKRNTNCKCMVIYVHRITKNIIVADPTGLTDLEAAGVVNNDVVCRADSYGYGLQGFDDWIKSSGTILGIALTEVPDLCSFVSTTGGILTETKLNQAFGDFTDAYGMRQLAGVTTTGVINKHMDDLSVNAGTTIGVAEFQRQGAPLRRVSGRAEEDDAGGYGFVHEYCGMRVPIYCSAYQLPGTAHFMEVGQGNLKRYAPPRVGGFGQHASFGGEIEFLLGFGNNGNIFGNAPVLTPGGTSISPSDWFWAPFSGVYNRMATRPQGIKLTGLTESTPLTWS